MSRYRLICDSLPELELQGILFLVNCPAAEETKYGNEGDDPKPNGRMHTVDTYQCDEDRAAGASQNICDKETAGGNGAESRHVTHQVTGKDG